MVINWMPPRIKIAAINEGHPVSGDPRAQLNITKIAPMMPTMPTKAPIAVATRSGAVLNAVMLEKPRRSIRVSEYLVVPFVRGAASYSKYAGSFGKSSKLVRHGSMHHSKVRDVGWRLYAAESFGGCVIALRSEPLPNLVAPARNANRLGDWAVGFFCQCEQLPD